MISAASKAHDKEMSHFTKLDGGIKTSLNFGSRSK